MLHLLTKKSVDFGVGVHPTPSANPDTSADRIRLGLTKAAQEPEFMAATDFLGTCGGYPPPEFGYGGGSGFGDDGEEEENRVLEDPKGRKSVLFDPDCVLRDLPADDDQMNPWEILSCNMSTSHVSPSPSV